MSNFSKIGFIGTNFSLLLSETVQSTSSASYSPILSLTYYLSELSKNLAPPTFYPISEKSSVKEKQSSSEKQNIRSYFQPWCDYLTSILFTNNAHKSNDIIHFLAKVSDQYLNYLKETIGDQLIFIDLTNQIKDISRQNLFEVIFGIKINPTLKTKNIGIINFATSQLRRDHYAPKIHLDGLISGIWFNNQNWKSYSILKADFPTEEQLLNTDVFILGGSSLSVNQNNPQILQFLQKLQNILHIKSQLKILGICFGHQAMSKLYNGKIQKRKWIGGVRKIKFAHKLIQQVDFLSPLRQNKPNTLHLSKYHSDYVFKVPEGFQIIASSSTCEVEALLSSDKKKLSFQFHPEYCSDFVKQFEHRNKSYNGDTVFVGHQQNQNQRQLHLQSILKIRKVISNFLQC